MQSRPVPPTAATRPAAPASDAAHPQRRRKRLMADLTVDSRQVERRETSRTLMVLGMFIVAAGLCAVVFHLMTSWAAR